MPTCVAFEFGVPHGGSAGYALQPGDCQPQSSATYSGCDGFKANMDLYIKKASMNSQRVRRSRRRAPPSLGKSADQQIPDQCSKTATCQQLKDKGLCPSSCGGRRRQKNRPSPNPQRGAYGALSQMSCRFSCGLEAATACRCDCTCNTAQPPVWGMGAWNSTTNTSVVLRSESSAPEALVWQNGALKASCVLVWQNGSFRPGPRAPNLSNGSRLDDLAWPPTCPSSAHSPPRCMFRRTTCSGDRREHSDVPCSAKRKNFNYKPGCIRRTKNFNYSCINYGGESKMAGFCDCNGNNIRDSGEPRFGCNEPSNDEYYACTKMCRQSFCSWTRVAGKFSAGRATRVALPAEKAKQACEEQENCNAVTCENSESCSVRTSSTLSTSPSNETTYLLKCSNSKGRGPKLNDLVYGSIVPNKKVNTSACPQGSRPLPKDVCEQVAFAQGSAFSPSHRGEINENGEVLPAGCHKLSKGADVTPTASGGCRGALNFGCATSREKGLFTYSDAAPYRMHEFTKTQFQTVCQKV